MTETKIVPFEEAHLETVLRWVNDPEITELIGTVKPISRIEHRAWYESLQKDPSRLYLVIEDGTRAIGMIGLAGIESTYRNAELFIYLGEKESWGQGHGRRAAHLLMSMAFDTLGLHRLFAHVFEYNRTALAFFESLGFRREGMLREAVFKRGGYFGKHVLGLLAREFRSGSEQGNSANPFLPFALPDISEAEIDAVVDSLRSGWITTGPKVKEFEQRFAEAVGAKHAVALNSCTAALHLALEAIGIGPDDEVIVPALTFAATAEVVRYLGARPVLVDSLPSDHNLDPTAVEAAVTPKTKALIPVHFGGKACDLRTIHAIAGKHDLKVIEDAAHAFPAFHEGRAIGSQSDIVCFSFYATKTITTAEGGMAVTGNEAWADRMRVMALHGISKDAWKRYTAQGNWYYEIVAPGFKYNMTDLAAAMGLVQLDRARKLLDRRRAIVRAYTAAFADLDTVEPTEPGDFDAHAWHLFVIRLRPGAPVERDLAIELLKERGIGASVHFIPLHLHPYYRETYGYSPDDFPVAHDLYRRSISLPLYSRMTDADVERVIDAVRSIFS
jgi:UDP-4-amino-4,6-dideoxy-N-acetyl-beta-L-altrosamine N-acetyltransferase